MTAFGVARGVGVVGRRPDGAVVRLSDLGAAFGDVARAPSLNGLLALGPQAWADATGALASVDAPSIGEAELVLPFEVADYVDFYASRHHAENLGRLFRPDGEALLPNWLHLPVGYHGRSGTVVVSGTPVRRPTGLVQATDGSVQRRPSAALDLELEVGFVVGVGSPPGTPIAPDDADRHVFGAVLVNDWSARDLQRFEYQPLGPFLGKSFATSVGAWVVPLEALRPALVAPPEQDPAPDEALRAARPWGLDVDLSVELNGTVISRASFADQWWTFAQMLAHVTSNGASTRTGDLLASGTVSGPDRRRQAGSLVELTWGGTEPLVLADGSERTYLADGDEVVLRGTGPAGIDLGECRGRILPAG